MNWKLLIAKAVQVVQINKQGNKTQKVHYDTYNFQFSFQFQIKRQKSESIIPLLLQL